MASNDGHTDRADVETFSFGNKCVGSNNIQRGYTKDSDKRVKREREWGKEIGYTTCDICMYEGIVYYDYRIMLYLLGS